MMLMNDILIKSHNTLILLIYFVYLQSVFFIKEPPTPQFTLKIELATLYTFDLR
jgi:hypothetical protein